MEENNPLPNISPVFKSFLQLLILVGLYMVFAVLAAYAGIMAAKIFLGVEIPYDLNTIDFDSLDAHTIMGHKVFQVVASFGAFIGTALIFARFFTREKLTTFFGFSGVLPPAKQLVLTFIIALAAIPVISFIVSLNQQIPLPADIEEMAKAYQNTNEGFNKAFLKTPSIGVLLLNLIVIAIVPAIGEELLFRGAFMQLFYRFFRDNIHLAIVVVAILFSVMHLQYYNFLAIVFMGIIFGYIYYWSGNIMVAIWAHFINNGTAVLLAYFAEHNPEVEFFRFDYEFSPIAVGISAVVLAGAIFMFYKSTKQYHPTTEIDDTAEAEEEKKL
jgi:hypothetical protein